MKKNAIITLIFSVLYFLLSKGDSVSLKLANTFFYVALVQIMIALAIHVKNLHFFKFFKYGKYLRHKKKLEKHGLLEADDNADDNIDQFHKFFDENYGEKVSPKNFYIIGIPSLMLSCVFVYLFYHVKF